MDEDKNPQEEVIEGALVEDATQSTNGESPQNQATVFLSLENLIKEHVATIERIQKELRDQKEMIDNVLASDATYKEHSDRAKEANKVKAATKQQILKRPDVTKIAQKVKEMRDEIKDQQTTLSELLQEYRQGTGMNEIEVQDGIREIVYQAKLVRKAP